MSDSTYDAYRRAKLRDFGDHIREARIQRGISQEQVAHDAGIGTYTYGCIERGYSPCGREVNPTFDTLLKILTALDITWLLAHDDQPCPLVHVDSPPHIENTNGDHQTAFSPIWLNELAGRIDY